MPRPRLPALRVLALPCLLAGAGSASAATPADAAVVSPAPQASTPLDLLATDGARVAATRDRALAGDPQLQPLIDLLVAAADEAAAAPMVSVADKKATPPSGDKNDYVSLSPYWWPNPDTDDGLPYVRRDGEFNPERDDYDVPALDAFGKNTRQLGFAYYFTGEEEYAGAAVARLEHFLLDPETRMNPRMLFAQFVPGVSDGRKYGIIETLRLRWVPDAVLMLQGSEALTPEVLAATREWFGDYALWMNTSEFGVAERDGDNNHATWAKAQIAYYSAFAGDPATARDMAERAVASLPDHVAADGSQPEEIARTRGIDYSEFNLRGFSELAILGQPLGVDLWHHETGDGRSLRMAYDFLLPYVLGEKDWPHRQIKPKKDDRLAESLRRFAIAYDDPTYEAAISSLTLKPETRILLDLLMPLPEGFPLEADSE